VIQVEYDPETISYAELLDLFWGCHDPTTPNRQGGDVGTQYRSVILYHDAEQQAEAMRSKAAVASDFADRLVTEISPLSKFYPAETYHQGYYQRNREASYCQIVIRPKLRKLEIE
jgi:peptide-methionine (S)-S-oxide reductase